jgi:hypothetical protein
MRPTAPVRCGTVMFGFLEGRHFFSRLWHRDPASAVSHVAPEPLNTDPDEVLDHGLSCADRDIRWGWERHDNGVEDEQSADLCEYRSKCCFFKKFRLEMRSFLLGFERARLPRRRDSRSGTRARNGESIRHCDRIKSFFPTGKPLKLHGGLKIPTLKRCMGLSGCRRSETISQEVGVEYAA